MSHLTSSAQQSERPLTASMVRRFLADNPEFLAQHPDIMAAQVGVFRKERSDGTIDFQQRLMQRLRSQTEQLMAQRRDMLALSFQNEQTQARIHAAALHLMDAPTLSRLLTAISCDLAVILDVDLVALLIEASARHPLPVAEQIHIVPSGTLDLVLNEGTPVQARSHTPGDPVVFGERAGIIRSQMLMGLSIGTPPRLQGLIAFGSKDPDAFAPDLATDAVEFLASVVQRCLARFLAP